MAKLPSGWLFIPRAIKKGTSIEVEQKELVTCKDCKHWMPYDWMFSEICKSQNINDYSEDEIGCRYCDMNMSADDYCSRAERKEE